MYMQDETIQLMDSSIIYPSNQSSNSGHSCCVCGSKSVGMNFGVLTCSPCKAFFRRNARRKELLKIPCRHRDLRMLTRNNIEFNERTARYLQIRRCSSCRLRRCFEIGMREELVRTNEENERYRQLVDINRARREMLKEQVLQIQKISIPQNALNNNQLSYEVDWCHLSNIVYAYDINCLKTFTQQRDTIIFNKTSSMSEQQSPNPHPRTLTMCIVLAVSSFLKSLPAFYSLRRSIQNYLCKTNLRPLMFPSIHELNQSCFSEPWQVAAYKATWEMVCGPQLYTQFIQAEQLGEKLWITDPVVTRLWIIILFFSTPLHYHDDSPILTPILKRKLPLHEVQNAYITLLWKYLLYRHGDVESIRIFSNLVRGYLKMQSVGFSIYLQLRSKPELLSTHETLNKLVTLYVNDDQ